MRSLFIAPNTLEEARAKVTGALEGYTLAVVKLGAALGLQLLTYSQRIEGKIDDISERLRQIYLALDSSNIRSGQDLLEYF